MRKPPFEMIVESNMEKYRYESFWIKEPETIEWIKSFDDGDIFIDVGANVGVYSLYCASIHPQCKIFSFEPDIKNHSRLIENINKNNFYNILALPWIVTDKVGWIGFKTYSEEIGSSNGQMQEEGSIFCFSIDRFLMNPNHVKIDIDGKELKVIHGMQKTLKNRELKSVLIEINNGEKEIIHTFLENGFSMENDFNKMENHSRIRRAIEEIDCENVVFTRD